MRKIKIITDSTSDLNEEHYKMLDAEILSLGVNFGEIHYVDRVDITTEEIYKKVKETNKLPKTNAVNIGEMLVSFEKYLKNNEDIIFVPISSKMSSNYNNALFAKEELEKEYGDHIRVLDSGSLSSGIGLQLFAIKKDIDDGKTLDEVYELAVERTKRVNAEFVVDTMEYLYKGGRCNGLSYFFGKNFHLHPVILVQNGNMVVHKITRGNLNRGVDFQVEEFKKCLDEDNVILDHIFVTHSGVEGQDKYMLDKVTSLLKDPSIVEITRAGSIVASHCGSGTIGLLYIKKR